MQLVDRLCELLLKLVAVLRDGAGCGDDCEVDRRLHGVSCLVALSCHFGELLPESALHFRHCCRFDFGHGAALFFFHDASSLTPLTQSTCFSVATTSTRSACASITASMSL